MVRGRLHVGPGLCGGRPGGAGESESGLVGGREVPRAAAGAAPRAQVSAPPLEPSGIARRIRLPARAGHGCDRAGDGGPPEAGIDYVGFCDMSFGSVDDAVLAIAHRDWAGRGVLDSILNQGPPPFDPVLPVRKFAEVCTLYGISRVVGDALGGETFRAKFREHGVEYVVSAKTTSQLYEALEPRLNGRQVVLLDVPIVGAAASGTHLARGQDRSRRRRA
jgi:hypothetical protein